MDYEPIRTRAREGKAAEIKSGGMPIRGRALKVRQRMKASLLDRSNLGMKHLNSEREVLS